MTKHLNLYIALLLIIILNLYVVYTTYHKEGFLVKLFKTAFNLIPIPAISEFYKNEIKTNNFFNFFFEFGFATFKLILLIGVMPWLLIVTVKAGVIGGMQAVTSGMFSAANFMFSKPKLTINPLTLINNKKMAATQLKLASIENKLKCLDDGSCS